MTILDDNFNNWGFQQIPKNKSLGKPLHPVHTTDQCWIKGFIVYTFEHVKCKMINVLGFQIRFYYVYIILYTFKSTECVLIIPAIHPWDCCTWWNHSDGRYSVSPALTVTQTGVAWAYNGYFSRSGFNGLTGIHGTYIWINIEHLTRFTELQSDSKDILLLCQNLLTNHDKTKRKSPKSWN